MCILPCLAVCQAQSTSRTSPRLAWCFAFLLFTCRVGEASNPGPLDSNFVLGAFNPSGLRGKAPFLVSHLAHGDIWAVSETHLCHQGSQDFRSSLLFANSPYKYCVTGHPVPAQHSKTHQGQWKGVAMLSRFPTRALPMHGPAEVFSSSRALVTTTLVDDLWIVGGVVYGEPDGHLYPQHMQHNELLLSTVVSQVCSLSVGPRFVAGDWNCLPNSLPVFEMLQNSGFCDLQDLAWRRWGIPPLPTCKHKTRNDFLFLSPELQRLLLDCQVLTDVWPDHAVLQGLFQGIALSVPQQIWPMPQPFPWPADWQPDPDVWATTSGTPDVKYEAAWHHLESTASSSLPFAVSKAQVGRAHATKTKKIVPGKIAPVKKGRNGDFAPHFLCASFRHSQWIRQVRRLQSYVHFANKHHDDLWCHHALTLWGSITRARGFPPSFCEWWISSNHRVHGAPASIPICPPDVTIASCICDSVALAIRALETQLKKSSRAYARLRRETNPNLIFQDIRSHADKGINLLLQPAEAEVVEVNANDQSITLDRSFDINPTRPVACGGTVLNVIHAEADCIWVHDILQIKPGDRVVQLTSVGSDEELFQVFMDAWKEKWGRHATVPPERWQAILAFAKDKLPKVHMNHQPMTPQQLKHAIGVKKKATSHGLDGVTLRDLQAQPVRALKKFCDMFAWAELSGEWPKQVIAGRVTSLAKNECPRSPMDFRPITVFGLLYRCWGSHFSKAILHALDPVLPVGLFGSRPTCYAGQVWSQVLWTIEHAQHHEIQLCGLLADLQKAFNMLPRLVVFEACAIIGVPFPILMGWAGALSSMPRRFQIRNSLSPELFSTCGFPEGDALSCVAMMVVDVIFHEWFRHFLPCVQPISYVDDWQLLLCNPDMMTHTYQTLDSLVHELGLLLDKQKSHVCAVHPDGRRQLRHQGYAPTACCKSLGAHIQVTKQHTNSVQMERAQSLSSLWPRLRLSACSYHLKIRALKTAAWPRGLHAIAATTLSLTTFQTMRSGAMKGLKEDYSGSNAHLHLGLIEDPSADPHFWSIFQTFRFIKDCGKPDIVHETVAAMALNQLPSHNSITATLLKRIQFLGWHITSEGWTCDLFGTFSLFEISCAELKLRMEWQWLYVVASATNHRQGLQELTRVWPLSTRIWLSHLSPSDQALYRKLLNGTHVTQDGKKYCNESDDDQCPFCACSDSRHHRFWICEHFTWARSKVSPAILADMPNLPEAVTCYGWDLMPSTMTAWWQYFSTLREPPPVSAHKKVHSMHVFTDGSCFHQSQPHRRFAAWAVILASMDIDDLQHSHVVESGPLPGLLQSAVRAEVYAAMRAIEFAIQHAQAVTVWTDSDAVVRRLRKLLAGCQVSNGCSHADLWTRIALQVQGFPGEISVAKVAAHCSVQSALTPVEEWSIRHNAMADREAVNANLRRPPEFWTLFQQHTDALEYVESINAAIHTVLLQISQEVVRAQTTAEMPNELDRPSTLTLQLPVWKGLLPFSVPRGASRWYGEDMVRLVLSWFCGVLFTSDAPMAWVSHPQLYADFMGSTSNPGPVKINGWQNGASVSNSCLTWFHLSTENQMVHQNSQGMSST